MGSFEVIKGVVFDKDGTLFGFAESWGGWCEAVLRSLSPGDLERQSTLARAVGYDLNKKLFLPGSAVVAADAQELSAIWAALLPDWTAEQVQRVGDKHLDQLPLVPVTDLPALLSTDPRVLSRPDNRRSIQRSLQ